MPAEPEALLAEISRLRAATRRDLGSPSYALLIFGAVTALAGLAALAAGAAGLVAVWVLGGVPALWLTGRAYRRRGGSVGVTGRRAVAWAWSVGLFTACFVIAFVVGRTGGHDRGLVAVVCLVAVAYAARAAWQRSLRYGLPGVAAALPALALAGAGAAPWLVELGYGLALMAGGVWLYRCHERDVPPRPATQR